MSSHGYKKYMKKEAQEASPFLKIFIISFFGMLLFFTFVIKSFMPNVDTSVGDYKEQSTIDEEEITKKIDNNSLEMIQNEDQGRNFSDLMQKAEDIQREPDRSDIVVDQPKQTTSTPKKEEPAKVEPPKETFYKVYIGSYTSAEQARVAKDIIQESGNGLSPIVKCIGSNNYTLQVGIFKNKQSAETLLYTVQQNHLPGRIAQDN